MRIKSRSGHEYNAGPIGVAAKITRTVFFFVFLAIGIGLGYFLVTNMLSLQTYQWNSQSCTILESSITEGPNKDSFYRLKIHYSYFVDGREYSSRQYTLGSDEFSSYSDAEEKLTLYPAGTDVPCYINPVDPTDAVIAHENLWLGAMLLLPLIIVSIGLFGLIRVWQGSPKNVDGSIHGGPKSAKDANSGCGVFVFGVVFVLAGLAFMIPFFILPAINIMQAKNWPATDCTVISSQVKSHDSDEGENTFSVEILYRYRVNGKQYQSDRYQFMQGSSSGYDSKKQIVNAHPPGKIFTCFYNPEKPSKAVVEAGFTWELLFGLLPLIFILVGVAVMFLGRGSSEQSAERKTRFKKVYRRLQEQQLDVGASGPHKLQPAMSRRGKLIGIIFFALLWNGIVGVFVYFLITSWMKGDYDWFMAIILTPFALLGLLLIVAIFHQLLAQFNPLPVLTINRLSIPMGSDLSITWEMTGKVQRLKAFTITLEGQEQATYRRGTNTHSVTETFFNKRFVNVTDTFRMRRGNAKIRIPSNVIHTFDAPNNKIKWQLKVSGDIPRWPDIDEAYEIKVAPMPVTD